MSNKLDLFSFNPEILTGLFFERIDDFRSKREELGDELKKTADQLLKTLKISWKFSKRLESDGDMSLNADIGSGEQYLIALSPTALKGTAYKASNMDFFLKLLAPLFENMLSKIPRETVNFLAMMFEFPLMVSEELTKSQLMDTWPFSAKLGELVGCESAENIEATSATFVYKAQMQLTHYFSGTLRLTGRNRIIFKMDTRKETGFKATSQSEISEFYNSAEEYAKTLIKGPLAFIFRNSKPEE